MDESIVDDDDCSMTEEEWLSAADLEEIRRGSQPARMLRYLRVCRGVGKSKHGRRKLRLFACACCRRFWTSLNAESREALETAERYADGDATKKDLGDAWRNSIRQLGNGPRTPDGIAGHVVEASAMTAAALVPTVCYSVVASTSQSLDALWIENLEQATIIQDIFGNPFRKTARDVASKFATVDSIRKLAEQIYLARNYDDLTTLAMELKHAGCTDTDVLSHCQQSEHFRGCWLVDALRGFPF